MAESINTKYQRRVIFPKNGQNLFLLNDLGWGRIMAIPPVLKTGTLSGVCEFKSHPHRRQHFLSRTVVLN